MRRVLRGAAAAAFATIAGVGLLVGAKTGPGTERVPAALPAADGSPFREGPPSASGTGAPPGPGTSLPTTAPTAPPGPTPSSTPPSSTPSGTISPVAATTTRPTTATPPPARPAATNHPTTTATHPTTTATARATSTTTAPPQTTATTAATTTTAPPATTTTTAPAGAPGSTTVDGPVISTRYGPVQVRLTFQGHQIVDVTNLQLPNHAARSQQINNRAGPTLRQEVLNAQSAQIDTVSGATVTSGAYAQCVQAILDQAWK